MTGLLSERQGPIYSITLNRAEKHNAFDDILLAQLQIALDEAVACKHTRVIVLKANGRHFSAGADLAWMERMAQFSFDENLADANILANVLYTLYQSPKPTIAMVQGAAFGGGAGLIAACDIAIAAVSARFCFSEVKLGLIPAVISPYVVKAIGERAATGLFMTAEAFDAQRALDLKLIHHCVPDDELLTFTNQVVTALSQNGPTAVPASKALVRQVGSLPIDDALQAITATLIAKQRASTEAQIGLHAFLNKETPRWS